MMNRILAVAVACGLWVGCALEAQDVISGTLTSQTFCMSPEVDTPHRVGFITVKNIDARPITLRPPRQLTGPLSIPELQEAPVVLQHDETRAFEVVTSAYFEGEKSARMLIVDANNIDGHHDFPFKNECPTSEDPPPDPGGGPPPDALTKVVEGTFFYEIPDVLHLLAPDVWGVPAPQLSGLPRTGIITLPGHTPDGGVVELRDLATLEVVVSTPVQPNTGVGPQFRALLVEDLTLPADQQYSVLTHDLRFSRFDDVWQLVRFLATRASDINIESRSASGLVESYTTSLPAIRQVRYDAPGDPRTLLFPFELEAGTRPVTAAMDARGGGGTLAGGAAALYYVANADADSASTLYCKEEGGTPEEVHDLGFGTTQFRIVEDTAFAAQNLSETLWVFARGTNGRFAPVQSVAAGAVISISVYFNGIDTVVVWSNGSEMRFLLVSPTGEVLFDETRPPPDGVDEVIHLRYDGAGGLVGVGTKGLTAVLFRIGDYISTLGLPGFFYGPA